MVFQEQINTSDLFSICEGKIVYDFRYLQFIYRKVPELYQNRKKYFYPNSDQDFGLQKNIYCLC